MRSALFLCLFVPTLAVAIPYSNDDLQPLPGDIEANARGINAHGVIVGQSISPDRLPSAVLWESALDSPRLLSGGLACVRGDQTYWFSVHTGTVFLSPSDCNRAPRIPEPGFLWALSLIPLVLATIADRLRTRQLGL